MLFNSYIFIFLFLPLCLAGFYMLQNKNATLAKVWLTCFSLWFYGYFNLTYLWIMLGSIIGNYFVHGKIMAIRNSCQGEEQNRKSKKIMITGVIVNLLVLFYFKYFDFFIENINLVLGSSLPLKHILLPLGISFFTFQQISFLVDSYRGELDRYGKKNGSADWALENKGIKKVSFIDYALFVSFFPQLIAGPIVVHEEMMPQFARIGNDDRGKEEKLILFTKGIYVFVLGLAKKVLIADTFGMAVDYAYNNVNGINGLESFLVIIFYSLQLYFDFSGYCDMAKGIAGMFGMQIAGNFSSPYKASNIVEFWKRWHITLSRFFTKNIYIPLGGNRKGAVRMYWNFLVVFFLSGLWHGAGWNYILWGMMHGVLYVITKWWGEKQTKIIEKDKEDGITKEKKTHVIKYGEETEKESENTKRKHMLLLKKQMFSEFCVLFTYIYVSIAWVYFRANSIEQANVLLSNVFLKEWTMPGSEILDAFNLGEFWYLLKILKVAALPYAQSYLMVAFTVVVLLITFFGKNIDELAVKFKPTIKNAVIMAILFLWCIVSLSGVSTFLYFNF